MVFRNYCMNENDEITDVEIYQLLDSVRYALEAYNTAGTINVDTRKFSKLKEYDVESVMRIMITGSAFYIYSDVKDKEIHIVVENDKVMYLFIDNMIFRLENGTIVGWIHIYCNSPLDETALENIEVALDGLSFNSKSIDNFNMIIQIMDSVEFEGVES